jgi:hypothetical protein
LVLLSQETHAGAYTHAGPEIEWHPQSFTTQITVYDCASLGKKPKDPFTLGFLHVF